jgi:group I intron endonuclease
MESLFSGWVYRITNIKNNKVYIGITTLNPEKRIKQHFSIKRSGCPRLAKALSKYGVENFKWDIVDTADSIQKLTEKEVYYISVFKSNKPKYGYNILSGGFCNEGAIKARRCAIYNVDSGEIFQSVKQAGKFYGIPKEMISLQLQGRQLKVKGLCFKYVDIKKQQKLENRIKNKRMNFKFKSPILCVELNQQFNNIRELAKAIGFSRNTVGSALNGKKTTIPYTLVRLKNYNKGL